jgi:hypothetical protein
LVDHAAADGMIPKTAMISMVNTVVFPPPRRPAVMKKHGR